MAPTTVLSETTMSPAQAAEYLHTSPRSIVRWAEKGCPVADGRVVVLEAVRVGTRWRTSREACERFTAATTARPTPAAPPPVTRPPQVEKALARLRKKGLPV